MKVESLHATFVLTFFTNFHVALCQVVVKSLFKKKNQNYKISRASHVFLDQLDIKLKVKLFGYEVCKID